MSRHTRTTGNWIYREKVLPGNSGQIYIWCVDNFGPPARREKSNGAWRFEEDHSFLFRREEHYTKFCRMWK